MHEAVPPRRLTALPFHYGWVIVATGTLTIFACLGLGRFALGMLLPSMGASLGLSYAEMGFISTGNFIGYLAAVLLTGRVVARLGSRRLIAVGLFLVAVSMLAVSQAGGFVAVLVLYVVTGLGSGWANVPLMGLVPHWFTRSSRGKAAGYMVIGSGPAIVFAGLLVPAVNAGAGAEGWRLSWLILGGISLAIAAVALALLRDRPAEIGCDPIGFDAAAPAPAAPAAGPAGKGALYHLGGIYFLFGYTYVIYATFIVTTLVQERGFAEATAGQFWAWVGLLSLVSGPVFGALSDRAGRKAALVTVFALQAAAYLLMAVELPLAFVYLSVFLYGVVAWSVPSIMAAAVGDYMGPERAAAGFGVITFFFGLGQIAGPGLAGVLAEASGSFGGSYLMAAGMAGLAIALTLFLRRPDER